MILSGLAWRGILHHWAAYVAMGAGVVVAGAVLTGALLVGDSVRGTLRSRALVRIGGAELVLSTGDRPFRPQLARDLEAALGGAQLAPALLLPGHVTARAGQAHANGVQVLGCDGRLLSFAPGPAPAPTAAPARGEALLSSALAEQLGVGAGEEVLLRMPSPTALSRDMVLAAGENTTLAVRVRVAGVVGDAGFGSFALSARPGPALNLFCDLAWLQDELELGAAANLMLARGAGSAQESWGLDRLQAALRETWRLADAQIVVRRLPGERVELSSPRVFLDRELEQAARALDRPSLGVLTYFVNSISHAGSSTPYSMVTGLGALAGDPPSLSALIPSDLRNGLVVSDWLAEDQDLQLGDELGLRFFVPGSDRALVEDTAVGRVVAVAPHAGLAADAELMPKFPGLEGEEHCRDWEPGIPIDLETIRDKDETYWDERGGTPKAFLSLERAQALWSNRFGSLTALRAQDTTGDFVDQLRARVDPAALGLFFRDLRGPALAAAESPTDFGGLFMGLSFFLLASALGLAAMLLTFGVERRAREVGLLLALGFAPAKVRRLFLMESGLVAIDSSIGGALLGLLYHKLVLAALDGRWQGAVAGTALEDHGRLTTVAIGAALTWVAAMAAAALALRGLVRREARELLAASEGTTPGASAAGPHAARFSLAVAALGLLGALLAARAGAVSSGSAAAGAFFGAGAALLVAGLAASRALITRMGQGTRVLGSLTALGWSGAGRRPGRSLAVVGLLSAGSFLVLSIGVHARGEAVDASDPSSGTGGFALFGSATLPLYHDPTSAEGQEAYALTPAQVEGLAVVPLRVREGDEASCLNLGAPQAPRLCGVDAAALARRGCFTFAATAEEVAPGASPWSLLEGWREGEPVPAVGDAASVAWSLKKAVGDRIAYVDGEGRSFDVLLVGTVADSILQGNLLIPEAAFQAHFPGTPGFSMLLVNAPPERAEQAAADLTRALSYEGLELVPTARRLARFRAVQDTYLAVFQLLGGLGLLLGTVGLGVVILRNAHERRRELALLTAVGYAPHHLRRMLVAEHGGLATLALVSGVAAALLALAPLAGSPARGALVGALPWILALSLNALLWTLIAARAATRRAPIAALRSE